jgi:hypothetical protein
MIFRLLLGVGLLAAGYYVGREVGRTESARGEIERSRKRSGKVVETNDYKVETPESSGPASSGNTS